MLLLFLLVPGGVRSAHAGAWTLPEGEGLAIATIERARSRSRFGSGRERVPAPPVTKNEARLLLEYGLSERVTLRGKAASARFETAGRRPGDPNGVEFGEIGARVRLLERGGFVGSAEASARVADAFGTKVEEVEARLLGGRGFRFAGMPGFIDVQFGYLHRPGALDDDLILDLTAGIRPFERTQFIIQSFSAVTAGFDWSNVPIVDRHKLQGSVVQDLTDRWSVQFGGGATITGSETAAERFLFGALWLRF